MGIKSVLSTFQTLGWQLGGLLTLERPMHHLVMKHKARVKPGQRVLVIGPGIIPFHAVYTRKADCTVIDFDFLSQRFHKALGYQVIAERLYVNDKLSFPDNHFDHIFANNVFLVPYKDGIAPMDAELKRVLKPEGRFWESFAFPFLGIFNKGSRLGEWKSFIQEKKTITSTAVLGVIFVNLLLPFIETLMQWSHWTPISILTTLFLLSWNAHTVTLKPKDK